MNKLINDLAAWGKSIRKWSRVILSGVLGGIGYLGGARKAMAQMRGFDEGSDMIGGVPTLQGLEVIFNNIVVIAVGIAGLTVFIMLIMGGVQFITSGGEAEAAAKARKTLTYAVLGLVLLVGAFLILRLIQTITGVDVTRFKMDFG